MHLPGEHSLDTYHATLQAVRRDEIDYHAFSTAWQAAVQLLRSAQTAQLQGALRSKTLAFAVQVMKGPSHNKINKHVVESWKLKKGHPSPAGDYGTYPCQWLQSG